MDPRERDAEIAEKIFGWKEFQVPPDASGENACVILVPPEGLGPDYQLPPKGRLHRGFMTPRYHFDLFEAIELANKVGLRFSGDIPTWAGQIAEAAWNHWRAALETSVDCICRPVGCGDGDTYVRNPSCKSDRHG